MIFPNLENEPVVQVNDRTRLSALKTYAAKGSTIIKVEIEPDAGAGYIDVTGSPMDPKKWFTDWQYATAGAKVISVRVNEGEPDETIKTFPITIVTEADDALFASDSDLAQDEPDILRYVKDGRNSYKDVHREVQKEILDLINRKGYRKPDGTKITKADVVDKTEVREMAKYYALWMIFEGISNKIGDVFSLKASEYRGEYTIRTERQILALDLDGSGTIEPVEGVNLQQGARLIRR